MFYQEIEFRPTLLLFWEYTIKIYSSQFLISNFQYPFWNILGRDVKSLSFPWSQILSVLRLFWAWQKTISFFWFIFGVTITANIMHMCTDILNWYSFVECVNLKNWLFNRPFIEQCCTLLNTTLRPMCAECQRKIL